MKFTRAKSEKNSHAKEKPASKLPRNSRFIPEKIKDEFILLTGFIVIIVAGIIVGFDLYKNISEQKELSIKANSLQSRLIFWQEQVKNRPDYRDGYFSMALISYQLKDFESSKNYLDKALSIDPNFEKGRELQKLLSASF